MANKPFRSLAFVIFTWCYIGFCRGQGGVGGGGGNSPPCLEELFPCQQFLQSSKGPEASCCAPLKDLVKNNAKCLCDVFDNPVIMKGLNVTLDNALKLGKACGVNVDTSLCRTADTPPTVSPPTHTHTNSSTTDQTSSTPAKNTATNLITHFGGSLSFAAFLVLFISVF